MALAVLGVLASPAFGETGEPQIRNNYGALGLLDLPSARMAPDGELSLSASFFRNTQHYNFGFQAMPWLETNFRYTGLQHFNPQYPVYYDRAFAAKIRLVEESDIFPAIALGVNDVIGTGIYSSEYLVASKRFGAVDATLGLGWGRLGEAAQIRNPFSLISESFKTRTTFNTPGGTPFNKLFHGPNAGVFGGVTWNTPLDGLSLIAEFSSDKYSEETIAGTFRPRNQVNFGAVYQPLEDLNIGLAWLYGESLALNFSYRIDIVNDPYAQRLGAPALPPAEPRTLQQQQQAIALLGNRQSPNAQMAAADSGRIADALWQNAAGVTDVAIQGSTIVLTVSGAPLQTACASVARLSELYRAGFVSIAITNGRDRINCAVTPFGGMQAALPATTPAFDASRIVGTPVSLVTIDARGPAPVDERAALASIRKEAALEQIGIRAISFLRGEALVYYTNGHYYREREALDRLVRILMQYAPPQIERFRMIAVRGDEPIRQFELLRTPLERNLVQTASLAPEDVMSATPAPMQNPLLTSTLRSSYPRFNWQIFPQFRQELFDPNNPFAVQFLGGVAAMAELWPGFAVIGEGEVSVWDNFNIGRTSDSLLPHVRTGFLEYFTKGKNGIGELEADYRFRLSPTVFAIARAGYLESMFAGAGGEVLWRPEGWRWAVGIDLYYLRQRNFDRLLGLQPYGVTTGHISLYYHSPWYGLDFTLRAGQYLAGDRGLTLEVARQFESGVQVGAFMTKTNVSAQTFGEGSFDKGIFIRLPLGFTLPIHTQSMFNLEIRPVQRDGGQRLLGDTLLYDETGRPSPREGGLPEGSRP